jgi:anhydro-N-acetylmuramic acid kinase
MSGTSLDGLDLALVKLSNSGSKFELIKAETVSYSKDWESILRNSRFLSGNDLIALNVRYGKFLGHQINKFLKNISKPDLIASHGHTVFHQPNLGYTLQIGDINQIAVSTGITTVGDFRSLDVSKGGQGAPLVPIGDELLFSEYDYCLNLGGISNYSSKIEGKRIAKDISPCNIVSNLLANKRGLDFDKNGDLGRQGLVDEKLLHQLRNWSYYSSGKSIGVENLEKDFIPIFESSSIPLVNQLRTFYEHVGEVIGFLLKNKLSSTLVTGGGTRNQLLLECIKKYSESKIIVPKEDLIDFKEAIIFALLGFLRINNQINVLSSVTGASMDSSAGIVINP